MAAPPPDFTSYGAGADRHDRLPSPASSISHHVEGDCSTGYGILDPPAPAPSPLPLNELSILHNDPDCMVSRLLELPVCTCCLQVQFERSPSFIGFINASPSPPSKPEHLQCYPFQPDNMSGPTTFDGEVSALDWQESFNFPLSDEINNEINLRDLLASSNVPPASVMDGCTEQNAVFQGVDQVSQTISNLQHFNQPLQLKSCLTSSPTSMEDMVYTGGISGPILPTELSNVTPSSSLFYGTSNLYLEPAILPAPLHGVTMEQNSYESFYEVEDMGSVHGRNELAATRLTEIEICGRIGMLACGGQAGGMKPKEQLRALISPSPFHGVAAEEGPQESFLEVEGMHGGNQAATRLNKTEFYREIDRLAWRKHGQPLGIKAKKWPRCMSISARACGGVCEDKDHICDGEKVNFRVKTQNILLDDGFLWLKYGQKPINGHTHPRSYLRCANAWSGCKVQKRVKRCSSFEDSVDFLYLGRHNHSP
ncbi:hypothetical protein GOP47_0027591 [Adiantum capillus-veneris]|nr:hypothetical protein GOP47_0027591 [Adiantum capillus-veneris]